MHFEYNLHIICEVHRNFVLVNTNTGNRMQRVLPLDTYSQINELIILVFIAAIGKPQNKSTKTQNVLDFYL